MTGKWRGMTERDKRMIRQQKDEKSQMVKIRDGRVFRQRCGRHRDLGGAQRTRRFQTQKSLYLTLRRLGSLEKVGYSSKHKEKGSLLKQSLSLSFN